MPKGSRLLQRLQGQVLLLDGAMGTELHKRGLRGSTALANLQATEAVVDIHLAYLQAGADILETNTFSAARYALSRDDRDTASADLVRRYNLAAVSLARQASAGYPQVFVAGSMGPLGKVVAPARRRSFSAGLYLSGEEAYAMFREQAEALKEGGVDFLVIETMVDLNEAIRAVKAARETGLVTMVSFTLEDDLITAFGNSLENCVTETERASAEIIGINCSTGVLSALEAVRRLRALTERPIAVYPNAGKPDARGHYRDSPDYMAEYVDRMIAGGANIVGGCCGTSPAHIRAFREAVDRHR